MVALNTVECVRCEHYHILPLEMLISTGFLEIGSAIYCAYIYIHIHTHTMYIVCIYVYYIYILYTIYIVYAYSILYI